MSRSPAAIPFNSSGTEIATNANPLRVDPTGTTAQPVSDGGGSLTVDAASLPLPTGAATAALQTQPGVDIGDVTINNAAGASAVHVQDGGNSLTVDGPLTNAELRAGAVPVIGTATTLGQTTLVVADEDVATLLRKVLIELRKLNWVLAHTWEVSVENEDLE